MFMKPLYFREHTSRLHTSQHTMPCYITLGFSAPVVTPLVGEGGMIRQEALGGEVWAFWLKCRLVGHYPVFPS
jgi:hypothetical protein